MSSRKTAAFYLKSLIILLFVVVISGYALYRSQALRQGPELTLDSPKDGQLFSTSDVEISGTAKNIAFISLNDRQIFTDETGHFSEKLLLPYGYTILKVEAKDKFGKTVVKKVEVVYK
ncbi:MAG: hypothetical protein RLZZ347_408 [Candidatus Parcubacteria bacterium]|jgi:hypothetical protein